MPQLTEAKDLPYWAAAALIIRCAERHSWYYSRQSAEPTFPRVLVSDAVKVASQRISHGGPPGSEFEDAIVVGDQYFDHYDTEALRRGLCAAQHAAFNTFAESYNPIAGKKDEINQELSLNADAITLALCALEAAFPEDAEEEISSLISSTADIVTCAGLRYEAPARRDLQLLGQKSSEQLWADESGVDLRVLGPIWETSNGRASGSSIHGTDSGDEMEFG